MTDETAAPTPQSEDQPVDTYTDLTARLAAADLGWSHEHGDPPANPDYIKRLAFQVMAFHPPLVAGVYVDDAMLNRMRDRLHGDRCGCGEWDSHSGEYVDQMDVTIHAVLYPLRHPARPVSQGTEDETFKSAAENERRPAEDSDYREQIARALVPGGDESTFGRVMSVVDPLVAQLRQARAEKDEVAQKAQSLLEQRNEARADLVLAAAEAEDARDGGLDLAQELAEVRESRDQYYKNWDAAVAANMTELETIGGLRDEVHSLTSWKEDMIGEMARNIGSDRPFAKPLREYKRQRDEVRDILSEFLGVEQVSVVDAARAVVQRCGEVERREHEARESQFRWAEEAAQLQAQDDEDSALAMWDLPHRFEGDGDPLYPQMWSCQVCGRGRDGDLHADGWARCASPELHVEEPPGGMCTDPEHRAAPQTDWFALGSAAPVETETPAPPTLAQTRTSTDWCPSCWTEAGTNRYGGDDDNPTERCASCGAALVPLPVKGVDWQPGCSNPNCESCQHAGRPCDEHMGVVNSVCPRCGWHQRHHLPVASPGTGTEAGDG